LVVESVEDDDDDDPLASAVLDPFDSPLAVVAARPRKERRPATTTATVTASGGRHRQARRKGDVSSTQNGGPSKSARRRTLDEELRNSDGITDEDLRLMDLEPCVFTSMAPTNKRGQKKGFLAHGGGAGVPVFMGTGDEFDGAGTEDHEEDIEIIDPPPPPRPSLIPRKPKGRAAYGSGRR